MKSRKLRNALIICGIVVVVIGACALYLSSILKFPHGTPEVLDIGGVAVTPVTAEDTSGKYGAAYAAAGYKATFTFDANRVDGTVKKVFVGGNLQFYPDGEIPVYDKNGPEYQGNILDGKASTVNGRFKAISAYEYQNGYFPAAYDTSTSDMFEGGIFSAFKGIRWDIFLAGSKGMTYDLSYGNLLYGMDKDADGVYTLTLPMPAGVYAYKFTVETASGDRYYVLAEAGSPTIVNGVVTPEYDVFFVGDPSEAPADQQYAYPRTDDLRGAVEQVTYTAIDGSTQRLAIYLPHGYDPSGEYKCVYISHGGGGIETDWFQQGCAQNIMDNMIAQDVTTEAVIVSMDNSAYLAQSDVCADNIIHGIIPFVEANYAVSKSAEDRAIAGLSMGGKAVTRTFLEYPDYFSYVGFFSGTEMSLDVDEWADMDAMRDTAILAAGGNVDFGMGYHGQSHVNDERTAYTVMEMTDRLDENDIPYTFYAANGAHDFNTWRACLTVFLRDIVGHWE